MLNHQYFKKKAERNKASFYNCDFSCTIDKSTVQCRYVSQRKYNSVKLLWILSISPWDEILPSNWEDLAKTKPFKKNKKKTKKQKKTPKNFRTTFLDTEESEEYFYSLGLKNKIIFLTIKSEIKSYFHFLCSALFLSSPKPKHFWNQGCAALVPLVHPEFPSISLSCLPVLSCPRQG